MKHLIIAAFLCMIQNNTLCFAQLHCSQLTNVRLFAQVTTAISSPQTPIRLQATFRINADRFRGNADNPSASLYINGILLNSLPNNGLRRVGGVYPEFDGFIEGTEYWELTAQNSSWYRGPGIYNVEWVLGVDNDILNCRRIVRSSSVTLFIATTATVPTVCSTVAIVETRLAGPLVVTNINTPMRFDGYFRMPASRFIGGGGSDQNPIAYIHINGGRGLIGASAYRANGISYLGGSYPSNNGILEVTENMQVIAANSAWYRGPGTYTFEYSLVTDENVSGCRKEHRSIPVTVIINPTTATMQGNSTSASICSIVTTVATVIQNSSPVRSNTPIRYSGIFRINAEKFLGGAVNPSSITYINGIPLSSFSPNGFRYINGEYPSRNGFIEATENFEIMPKGSAWYKGPGTYTIQYSLDIDKNDPNCYRQIRSEPKHIRIEDEGFTTSSLISRVYPNPASDELHIDISLFDAMPVQCSIVDVLGRKLADICNGQFQAGFWEYTYQLNQLAQGTYYCVITTPQETRRVAFQVIR